MKKCNARGSAARDPHGIKQITVGPPHGIKQITMFIRENVDSINKSFDDNSLREQTISNVATNNLPDNYFMRDNQRWKRWFLLD
ncbi:hypothetical protein J6590_083575 [Homalodisca vitripennis]|nr:hypothetical protein J6590_083575 [Homalodisca vitripennis]